MKLFAWEDFFPNSVIYIGDGKFESKTNIDNEVPIFTLQWTILIFLTLSIAVKKLKLLRI
ncbi:MAG: hypothetical protein HeimC2_00700 [Candidatus Heimdallarchaeota archaeon LC_2]|nr:MAG: hypothetical protein HeimC2_00700 [Candidatus Heimdallarchaeota archaeon LC_2]